MGLRNLKVKSEILLGFGIILIMFLTVGLYNSYSTYKISQSSRRIELRNFNGVNFSIEILVTAMEIEHSLSHVSIAQTFQEAEDAVRRMGIQEEKLGVLITEFMELVEKEPDILGVLVGVRNSLQTYYKLAEELTEVYLRGETSIELRNKFETISEELRIKINGLYEEDIAELSLALSNVGTLARQSRNLGLILLTISIVVTMFLSFRINKIIIVPLKKLLEATKALSLGRFNHKLQFESKDEIGELADSFRKMAGEIKTSQLHLEDMVSERTKDLAQAKELVEGIAEGIEEGIMLLDKDFKVLWANKKIKDSCSIKEGDIIGQFCYKITHHIDEPCKPPHDICPVIEVLKKKESITVTHTHFDKEGNKFYAEVTAYPLKDEKGEISQFIHVSRDVTERIKILEELNSSRNKLKEYAQKLEERVKERTKELEESIDESNDRRLAIINMLEDINETRDKLEQINKELKRTQEQLIQAGKMSAVGQLAGGVAHEINNPLTGVLNNVQLIKLEMEANKDFKIEEFKDLLDVIEKSAKRCASITHSLLDFSRKSKGEFEPLEVNEIVEGAFILATHELKLEQIEIAKELGDNLPKVLGNSNQLQQIILNLISNSKTAFKDKKDTKKITVKTYMINNNVAIEFSDNGCGISEENLKKIFEPFFTTSEVGKGTGLGLSISYGIIQGHKGTFTVTSKLKEGTRFTIILPVKA